MNYGSGKSNTVIHLHMLTITAFMLTASTI
jgi:hypothetical protein